MAGLTINPLQESPRAISRVNHTHVFMMDWLICNPGRSLRDLSAVIGYDRAWVSQVVNSDMFQAMYQQRLRDSMMEAGDEREAKLKAGAIEAVDCIRQRLEGTLTAQGSIIPPSEKFIIDAAKVLLPAAGYAAPSVSKASETQRHLHLHVDSTVLERSRERMRARFGTLVETTAEKDPTEPVTTESEAIEQAFEQMEMFEEVA